MPTPPLSDPGSFSRGTKPRTRCLLRAPPGYAVAVVDLIGRKPGLVGTTVSTVVKLVSVFVTTDVEVSAVATVVLVVVMVEVEVVEKVSVTA